MWCCMAGKCPQSEQSSYHPDTGAQQGMHGTRSFDQTVLSVITTELKQIVIGFQKFVVMGTL